MSSTALIAVMLLGVPNAAGVTPTSDQLAIQVGLHRCWVRIAATEDSRYAGLDNVISLGADEGMLFMYRKPRKMNYWMKGCRIALDIAFLSDDLTVSRLWTAQVEAPDTPDHELKRYPSPGPVKYVLELPAGWFERHGLGEGTPIVVPSFLLTRWVE